MKSDPDKIEVERRMPVVAGTNSPHIMADVKVERVSSFKVDGGATVPEKCTVTVEVFGKDASLLGDILTSETLIGISFLGA